MLVIGLTGNIGSGKSEVARVLAALGATVIDADELARDAVRPGTPALAAIAARWGTGMLRDDGSLDRAALRARVFGHPAELEALNAIVHPEVRRLRDTTLAEARARGVEIVVADIPLLFEAGLQDDVDRILLVDAPEAVRLDRLVRWRGLGEDEARRMMDAQWPSDRKRAEADWVIDNTGSLTELRSATERVWQEIREPEALEPGGGIP